MHRPFDDLAAAPERQHAVRLARDRHQAEVDVRRVRLVQLDLTRQCTAAQLERGEIHVVEANRPLDLVDVAARQKDDRPVRLDPLGRYRTAVRCRRPQEPEHLGLICIAGFVRCCAQRDLRLEGILLEVGSLAQKRKRRIEQAQCGAACFSKN